MARYAFVFPGQGSQAVGMGKSFYDRSEEARRLFARADEVLGFSISKLCFEGPEEELRLTKNTQPALLLVSTVAFHLVGRTPVAAAGHSLGEYSAHVAAGTIRFEDALSLVHKRGTYMQEAVPVGVGAMAALLGADYEAVNTACAQAVGGQVQIANWNSPEQIVISGHKAAVEDALKRVKATRAVMLPVSAPFHSALMKSAEDRLAADLAAVEFKDPSFPIITNVEARMIRTGAEAREALRRQVSRPVLWAKSMDLLAGEAIEAFVEIGPGKVLSGLIKRIGKGWAHPFSTFNVEDAESLDRTTAGLSV
jgi:[acyl-carrier-protein] S-malonyltransferase